MANKFLEGIKGFFYKLFIGQKEIRLGCYGSPNAGKTTLANKISKEFIGKEVGKVSNVPHETREVVEIEHIEMSNNGKKLTINLVDTPGIATKIDFEDFIKHGIKKKQAKLRAKEATKGIIEAIKWLDKMDVVLVVIDSTLDPYNQVNLTILGNLEARKIPVIIVANKIDLKNANLKRVKEMFPQYEIVGISAKTGKNIEELYKTIFKVSK
ncbi:MAG: Era-like GTP-binding protein [Candidatus Nanoarchaeia archaeon]|nr:Era-like GTP-binding protein [Candidatus Nanoarchaeia archaeon]MDD5054227.1 Era-like GTP-binding protein [Candidatus Nanoarchaeia archaeon]